MGLSSRSEHNGERPSTTCVRPAKTELFPREAPSVALATRGGYTTGQYGQQTRARGTDIDLGPAQQMKDIVIGLVPEGVISG